MSSPPPGSDWILSGSHQTGDGNQELRECARRAWPRVLSYARRQVPIHVSTDEKDSLATEVWEGVLCSVSRTLGRTKRARQKIVDLESYLIGAFQHRLNRALKKDKRRHRTIELIPPAELAKLADTRNIDWVRELERDLQIQQIVARMDDWTRAAWAGRQYGYTWREIAQQSGMTESQAKMRFRYAIAKIRKSLTETFSTDGYPNKEKGAGL